MEGHAYVPRLGDTWCATCNSRPGEPPHNDMTPALAWGFHRLKPDADTIVGWGARCIFEEVKQGSQGVVYNRQDSFGPKDLFDAVLSPCIDRWFNDFRLWALRRYDASASDEIHSSDMLLNHADTYYRVIIRGSTQSSYGYVYVTALLSKYDDHDQELAGVRAIADRI